MDSQTDFPAMTRQRLCWPAHLLPRGLLRQLDELRNRCCELGYGDTLFGCMRLRDVPRPENHARRQRLQFGGIGPIGGNTGLRPRYGAA